MDSAFHLWKKKDDPQWLLLLSRSNEGGRDLDSINLDKLNQYVDQFSTGNLPLLANSKLVENLATDDKTFFAILQKEGASYSKVFNESYTDELLTQAEKVCNPQVMDAITSREVNETTAGNLLVAIAIAAIRDMALLNDLHRLEKLTDAEHAYGMQEINNRMDRTGINGVDRLLESRPELERFLEKDKTVIKLDHVKGDYHGKTATRAAYYNNEKIDRLDPILPIDMTEARENVISEGFPALQRQKEEFVQIHVSTFPLPSDDSRKKFADKLLLAGRGTGENDLKQAGMLLRMLQKIQRSKASRKEFNEFKNVLLHDGLAINHPERDGFADKLRQRMKGLPDIEIVSGESSTLKRLEDNTHATRNDIILPDIIEDQTAKKETIEDKSAGKKKWSSSESSRKSKDRVTSYSHQPKDTSANPGSDTDTRIDDKKTHGNTGAKIATIGGGIAVGLLLATGRGGDTDKNQQSDQAKEQQSHVGKYVALATAAAVAAGGAIMWSKKPELLFKPLDKMTTSLFESFGKAQA